MSVLVFAALQPVAISTANTAHNLSTCQLAARSRYARQVVATPKSKNFI